MSLPSRQNGRRPRAAPTRLENMRSGLQQLFTGRSTVGRTEETDSVPETPKTPRLPLGLQSLPVTRFDIPHLSRSTTSSTTRSAAHATAPRTEPISPNTPISARPITPNSYTEIQRTIGRPQPALQSSTQPFVGVDPEEQHLAELAATGRRRRRKRSSHERPAWMPNMKNRKIRSKVLGCTISGLFLIVVLSAYLALALSTRDLSQEFHVLLIMIILVTTIFFCHSLLSVCMLTLRPQPDDDVRPSMSAMVGPGGYANPAQPIQVALTRDEEAVGIESEATKFPPPAYGLWRESVRVDPNRIYWQRNEAGGIGRQNSVGSASQRAPGAPRPPSYISEDGIDYVLEAAPRSIAPTVDVPLRQHPSERGRLPPGTI